MRARSLDGIALVAFVAGLLLTGSVARASDGEGEPLKKIDRAKVVGPPVLDETTAPGLYVWLEDGWFQLAAVTDLPFGAKKKRVKSYAFSVSSTKPIVEKLGGFKKNGGGEASFSAHVLVGPHPERGAFKTEGEVLISNAESGEGKPLQIYIGPLAKRAARSVRIGRF